MAVHKSDNADPRDRFQDVRTRHACLLRPRKHQVSRQTDRPPCVGSFDWLFSSRSFLARFPFLEFPSSAIHRPPVDRIALSSVCLSKVETVSEVKKQLILTASTSRSLVSKNVRIA